MLTRCLPYIYFQVENHLLLFQKVLLPDYLLDLHLLLSDHPDQFLLHQSRGHDLILVEWSLLPEIYIVREIPFLNPNFSNFSRNWIFATNSNFLFPISLQPNFRYFKLWILLDQIIKVWDIKGLHYQVAKI